LYNLQILGSKQYPAAYVTVPLAWVRKHGLDRGDKMRVHWNLETDEIIVTPAKARRIMEVAFVREPEHHD
tara:strand:- start:550 stop:759 length:210 start_codon:yes stop_codon:yes gene_type:complete